MRDGRRLTTTMTGVVVKEALVFVSDGVQYATACDQNHPFFFGTSTSIFSDFSSYITSSAHLSISNYCIIMVDGTLNENKYTGLRDDNTFYLLHIHSLIFLACDLYSREGKKKLRGFRYIV